MVSHDEQPARPRSTALPLDASDRSDWCRSSTPGIWRRRTRTPLFADGAAIIVKLLDGEHEAAADLGHSVTQLHLRFSVAYRSGGESTDVCNPSCCASTIALR